jgi:uncharacterized protein YaeQ
MALTATIYNFRIDLADVDRGVYEKFELRVARQPSETVEYLLMRVFAYCLEYTEGIQLTEGVAAGNDPAVLIRDMTGRITAWIEVGMPDAERLHRGLKLAGRAAVYTHRDVRKLLSEFASSRIRRLADIPIYGFDRSLVEELSGLLDRRTELALSITERELYIEIGGRTFSTTITEQRVSS